MRRILLRIWIFGLAFWLGISVSALWRTYNLYLLPHVSAVIVSDPPLPPPPQVEPLRIIGVSDACGPTANFHSYKLSDGSQITTACISYATTVEAARELRRRLGKANVSERSLILDDKGRPIGENILVTKPIVLRLSNYGREICVTEAPSLRHLQVLEG